jgi:hypothetical protein
VAGLVGSEVQVLTVVAPVHAGGIGIGVEVLDQSQPGSLAGGRLNTDSDGYSIRACFSRLCRAQSSWMLSAVREEPPRENGMMWSK